MDQKLLASGAVAMTAERMHQDVKVQLLPQPERIRRLQLDLMIL